MGDFQSTLLPEPGIIILSLGFIKAHQVQSGNLKTRFEKKELVTFEQLEAYPISQIPINKYKNRGKKKRKKADRKKRLISLILTKKKRTSPLFNNTQTNPHDSTISSPHL